LFFNWIIVALGLTDLKTVLPATTLPIIFYYKYSSRPFLPICAEATTRERL
jgi:hypothetical protein